MDDNFDELAAAETQLAELQAMATVLHREHSIHDNESHAEAIASAQEYIDSIKAKRAAS